MRFCNKYPGSRRRRNAFLGFYQGMTKIPDGI
jgi:hypothetical protein